jgi:putative PIN family toxin of toxin-antitoxin system
MLTVVLDVNVIVSAVASSRGTPRRILQAWQARRLEVVISEGILAEVSTKLLDPSIGGRLGVTTADVTAVMRLLRSEATLVLPLSPPVVTGDPEDDYVLATVTRARADYLVTGDKGLIALHHHGGSQIISPRDFSDLLDSSADED